MGSVKQRYGYADYLNTAAKGAASATYSLMAAGFTTLDESPSAQTSSKKYVNQKSATKRITGYDWSTSFTTDQIVGDAAVEFLCNIGQKELTGADAESEYVRVDLDNPITGKDKTYKARYHKVAVEIANFKDSDGEMTADGNLLGIGDVVEGEFNTSSNTFTPASEVVPVSE